MKVRYRILSAGMALLLVISAALGGGIELAAAATSHAALDGSASTGCGYVTSCSASLTTTNPSDVIIVGCDCLGGDTWSVRDTAGLTFTSRTGQIAIGGNQWVETWYAISPNVLRGDSITIQTTSNGETWYGVVAFAISGANTAQPFAAGSPIAQANVKGCGSPCNTGVFAPAGSFVFQVGGDTGSKVQSAGPGMTLIQSSRSGQDAYAQYEVPSAPMSGALLSFGTAQGSDFGAIVDAINAASSTSSSSTSSGASSTSSSSSTSMSSSSSSTTGSGSNSASTSSSTTSQTTTSRSSSTYTTTTGTTTTSTTSSAGRGTPGIGVFYLGAVSRDSSALPNTGARSSIQVQSFDVPAGCVSFWVSDDSASNLWMQVGYFICNGSVPMIFTQVWNLATDTLVYGNILSSTPTSGVHQFAVSVQSGTTWVATYDGTVVGSYNLGASVSSSSYPVYALSEENGLAAPISIPTTSFPVAIQARVDGVWGDPASISVYNYGGAWGLQGPAQNPPMAADSFIVGGLLATPSNGSPL